jgi:hypothetical protein
VDSTPTSVAITGLPLGRYKITVGSVNGCFLKSFDVTILECSGILPVQLAYFKLLPQQAGSETFEWQINHTETISSVSIERSRDGRSFTNATTLDDLHLTGARIFEQSISRGSEFRYYRLRMTDIHGQSTYSNVISTADRYLKAKGLWPNPARNEVNFQFLSGTLSNCSYRLYDIAGNALKEGVIPVQPDNNVFTLSTTDLPIGIYHLMIYSKDAGQPISFRFVKQQ